MSYFKIILVRTTDFCMVSHFNTLSSSVSPKKTFCRGLASIYLLLFKKSCAIEDLLSMV
jgi:hypothetical protein